MEEDLKVRKYLEMQTKLLRIFQDKLFKTEDPIKQLILNEAIILVQNSNRFVPNLIVILSINEKIVSCGIDKYKIKEVIMDAIGGFEYFADHYIDNV